MIDDLMIKVGPAQPAAKLWKMSDADKAEAIAAGATIIRLPFLPGIDVEMAGYKIEPRMMKNEPLVVQPLTAPVGLIHTIRLKYD